jgi:dTDP-4-amino-4,6-dideoxygalactose transaminase
MPVQRFNFLSNSLSKSGFFLSLWNIISLRSKRINLIVQKKLAERVRVDERQLFLFGAARMSVYTLLKSLKLSADDEIIVAGYTCVVLTNAVKFAGCKVQYVDIDTKTLNLNLDLLYQAITHKTKVIIIPHNYGLTFDYITEIKKHNPSIILIEDAAHCFGSRDSRGEYCGTIADAGFYSFEYSKPLTTGLGGAMIINNEELLHSFSLEYDKIGFMAKSTVFKIIISLGGHCVLYSKSTTFWYINYFRILRAFKWMYVTSEKEIKGDLPSDYPVRMNYSISCFLLPQLKDLDRINQKKIKIATIYKNYFRQFEDLIQFDFNDDILVRYPILFADNVSMEVINQIKIEALVKGINFGYWFNDVVHPAGSFRYCYENGACPVGENVAKRIINLPINANYGHVESECQELQEIFLKFGIK